MCEGGREGASVRERCEGGRDVCEGERDGASVCERERVGVREGGS